MLSRSRKSTSDCTETPAYTRLKVQKPGWSGPIVTPQPRNRPSRVTACVCRRMRALLRSTALQGSTVQLQGNGAGAKAFSVPSVPPGSERVCHPTPTDPTWQRFPLPTREGLGSETGHQQSRGAEGPHTFLVRSHPASAPDRWSRAGVACRSWPTPRWKPDMRPGLTHPMPAAGAPGNDPEGAGPVAAWSHGSTAGSGGSPSHPVTLPLPPESRPSSPIQPPFPLQSPFSLRGQHGPAPSPPDPHRPLAHALQPHHHKTKSRQLWANT